ncbi:MAG: DUF3667 domain-containing protein [Candidatus Cloacimonetes bacterium]|nr:DUF3667 domain-containing protein [Candidatus Cloacimonadota bacterium]
MPEDNKEIRHCPNCGEIVDNRFCPACGQENREFKANFKDMMREYISHVFNLDSRFYITLKYLITKPGFLTGEYFKGKRESYISPIRLYLIISMVYFLTFTVHNFYNNIKKGVYLVETEMLSAAGDSLSTNDTLKTVSEEPAVSTMMIANQEFQLDQAKISAAFLNNVPRIMFFLLPLAALILKLLYSRLKYFYFEHLVFLLHTHSFFFLTRIFNKILPFEPVLIILIIGTTIYLFFAQKNYYQQSTGKTILKMCLFATLYAVILIVLLFFNMLISFLSLISITS